MKQKRRIIAAVVLLLLILLASIPRLHAIERVDVSQISDYPVLQDAYYALCEEHSLYDIKTENTIQILTVRNLWGSWQRYILPCFAADISDVPTAGNADFTAYSCVLAPWDQENLFTRFYPLTFGLNVILEPGENVFVSSLVETVPDNGILHDDTLVFSKGINVNEQPETFVYYTTGTTSSAQQRDQETSSVIRWEYFLKIYRNHFGFGTMEIEKQHIVND